MMACSACVASRRPGTSYIVGQRGRLQNPNLLGSFRTHHRPDDPGMTTLDRITRNKQLVEAFIQDLFSEGDLDAIERYLDPSFVNHDPPFPGAPDGSAGMREAAAMFRRALPDWRSEVDQLIAEGDIVVEQFTARG